MLLRHRELAKRDCGICQKYLIDEETGLIQKDRSGGFELRETYRDTRTGYLPCPPMCRREEGCPKGTPENSRALNEANQQCYEHYLECRAVGSFPDDPIVRRNAVIIAEVINQVEKDDQQKFKTELVQLATMVKVTA